MESALRQAIIQPDNVTVFLFAILKLLEIYFHRGGARDASRKHIIMPAKVTTSIIATILASFSLCLSSSDLTDKYQEDIMLPSLTLVRAFHGEITREIA